MTKKTLILAAIGGVLLLGAGVGACGNSAGEATAARTEVAGTSALAMTSSTSVVDTRVPVPSVMGLTPEQAETKLQAAGFKIKVTGDTSNPKFGVLTQTPSMADKGSSITVTVGASAKQRAAREAAEAKAAAAKAKKEAAREAAEAKAAAAKAKKEKAAREAKEEAERAAAAKKAAEAAAKAAAERAADADLSTYAAVDERTWALVAKNPDKHAGEKYVIFGGVTQFDAATGTSAFLANTGATQQEGDYVSVYSYETNTLVRGDDAKLEEIVEDDLLKMFVKVEGSFSYDTQAGGNTTVPEVTAYSYELIGHDDN